MNALARSLVFALSMMVASAIGFAGCGSSSSPNNNDGGTGGASGAVGGSTGAGGASSAGGSTGAGGHADAGAVGGSTGAGGASATDAGSGGCANLLACCNSANASQAQLMALCLQQYNNTKAMGDAACSNVLQMIKNNGLCN